MRQHDCPRCWPWLPGPSYVACAATERSPTGPRVSGRNPGSVSGAVAKGALPFHRPRQPARNSRRPGVIFPGSGPTAGRGAYPPDHGRLETRKIWTTTELNDHLDFPRVGQAFVIERHCSEKKTGEPSLEIAYGLTRRTPAQADPQRVLQVNRGPWTIENRCHSLLDWNYDEDRSRIHTGHGPENITRLRRFAMGVI